jgi:protein LSM14
MSRTGPGQVQPPSRAPQPTNGPRPGPPVYPQQQPFPGYYPPYGQRFGPPGYPPPGQGFQPYGGAPPGWFPPGHGFPHGPAPGPFPPSAMPIGPPGQPQHRSGPPGGPLGPLNGSKQTSELPVSDKPPSKPASKTGTPILAGTQNDPTPPVADSKPPTAEVAQAAMPPAPQVKPLAPVSKSERLIPAIPISSAAAKPNAAATSAAASTIVTGTATSQGSAQAALSEASRAATAAVAAAMAKLPQPNTQKKVQPTDTPIDAITKKLNDTKPFDGTRPHRGTNTGPRGVRGGHRGHHHGQSKKIEVPDTDFDFESANAKFNKHDLVKEAIASGSPVGEPEETTTNGNDAETHSESIASSSTLAPAPLGYNKASSFFDNISSEIRDREEGFPRGRERRDEEEKKNIETFGQGSVDGYRGGYRARGRGRGYGGGRGRGGYRGYGNNRGRGGFRGGRGATLSTGVPTAN